MLKVHEDILDVQSFFHCLACDEKTPSPNLCAAIALAYFQTRRTCGGALVGTGAGWEVYCCACVLVGQHGQRAVLWEAAAHDNTGSNAMSQLLSFLHDAHGKKVDGEGVCGHTSFKVTFSTHVSCPFCSASGIYSPYASTTSPFIVFIVIAMDSTIFHPKHEVHMSWKRWHWRR